MTDELYDIHLRSSVRRALNEQLPLSVATACWEFCSGALRRQPYRVGKPLHGHLSGQYSARKSSYRIRYQVDEQTHTVIVIDIAGRADAYHRNRR